VHAVLVRREGGRERIVVQTDRAERLADLAGRGAVADRDRMRAELAPVAIGASAGATAVESRLGRAVVRKVQGGDPARNGDHRHRPKGTVGWSVILDGVPTAIGAWHVFAAAMTPPPSATIELGPAGARALLRPAPPLVPVAPEGGSLARSTLNSWDLSLATLTGDARIDPTMNTRGEGHRPYPLRLARDLVRGGTYYKVGAGIGPKVRAASFRGLGIVKVQLGAAAYWFTSVLIFDRSFGTEGDSGSVISEPGGDAAGMIFAINPGDESGHGRAVYANPLLRIGWRLDGVDAGVPRFVSRGTPDLSSERARG